MTRYTYFWQTRNNTDKKVYFHVLCVGYDLEIMKYTGNEKQEHDHSGERNGYSLGERRGWASHEFANTPTARLRLSGLEWVGTAEPNHRK